ncbi:adenosyl-hopene transferase HpnH [Dyella nitratireducens]|uniref:Hopanoid biosynthesis associated radical SAM protein HpnH n=1 Tax=Dyella nitratireducens TaxID=1849580 RepID=A0ABQ1FRW7_9GAMM|nr:adenosyl-hopene transferase HpnH [Dyella nitratireducens]GGA26056.1 hopanoid biosynthesis associated radical SAM protein HpnH [Dyella nitratireducens]GLQ43597.1 hopanoid biosynthesis associated radical SAM protein HpnH [Dyella nitratireducens]
MGIPLIQQTTIAQYILKKKLTGQKRYPLAMMLEPLFQCNLACAGCGKIDQPKEILQKRMSVEQALAAVDECDAPVVSIPGGEPLIHKDLPKIVEGIVARKKFVYLCTNAILLPKHIDEYKPSPYFTWSVHLDGLEKQHDKSVCMDGVFEKAVTAIKLALSKGFRVTVNCTLFNSEPPEEVADFFDYAMELGVEGITVSPGYSYQHAPRQDVFLGRTESKQLFRDIFKIGKERKRKWAFNQSAMFMDFIAGNQAYQCTPWSNPTYNIFGWQKPCYLLVDEGYAKTYKELMEDTEWEKYGVGINPKCDNCMAHCGFEGTAVDDMFAHPLKALKVSMFGPRTDGPMAPDLPVKYGNRADATAIHIPISSIQRRSAETGTEANH